MVNTSKRKFAARKFVAQRFFEQASGKLGKKSFAP